MTDPQNDKPCRDCGAPTQHDTERCDDCRTPAGRLVTALMDLNIDAEIDGRFVNVGCLIVDTNDEGMWSIDGHEEDGITAADAIAAIVQAPGLRSENAALAAEVKRLREEMEKPIAEPWEHGRCVRWCGHAEVADVDINGFVGWTVYRDRVAIAHGPESGDAGRHAADLALLAAGYRLVGGVHPLPDEVRS